ncbi:unnamed protein product [Arabidopsis thaliana]|uniref:DUF4283 domain-containing protein n=1 Tax=Arabidopsis thaliana TaxID=3702 RepID=A0A5S9WM87_ARATH|nr:unnamed protein product [Arabidopsis thaliana]
MFHQGGRSIEALLSFLPKENIWDVEGRVQGVSLNDSRFQFFFETEADLKKVLNKRPCHFGKWSFAHERWEPNLGDAFPNSMTFWTRTEGIPPEFWEEQILTIKQYHQRSPPPPLRYQVPRNSHFSRATNVARRPSGSGNVKERIVEDGRKRRFEESFSQDKNGEPSNKDRYYHSRFKPTSSHRSREKQGMELNSSHLSDSQLTTSKPLVASSRAKQGNSSPALVRERLFRLNFSANKSLTFDSLNPREDEPISATNLGSVPLCSQLEKRKSWYEMTLEEEAEDQDEDEDTPEENPESESANSLAVKFSKSINFTSPANLSNLPVTITATHDAEDGWVDNHHLMSEALNLDWTVEDDEAYHALEPSLPGDTEDFDVENDDLLGEDL